MLAGRTIFAGIVSGVASSEKSTFPVFQAMFSWYVLPPDTHPENRKTSDMPYEKNGRKNRAMPQSTPCPRMRSVGKTPVALLVLCLAVLLAGGCAGRKAADFQADGEATRFVLPGGSPASDREILALADNADYILVGEQHDNPVDHKAQAALLELLARRGGLLLGLEMLPRRYYDFQLAAFSDGRISLAELPEALNWRHTWGYDFALYWPIFETAQKHRLKIYGLNLPDGVRLSVSRKGLAGLSEAEKSELPARIIPPPPEQMEKLLAVFRMHGSMNENRPAVPEATNASRTGKGEQRALPAAKYRPETGAGGQKDLKQPRRHSAAPAVQKMLDRFVLIQSLWDSTMAEQAVETRKFARQRQIKGLPSMPRLTMMILAGAGHVEYGYGIASRIKVLEPEARILLVMPSSGEQPESGAADLYYLSEPRSRTPSGFTFAERKGKLLIINVAPGSRAEAAGMRPGDVIVRAGDMPVLSPEDMHKAAVQAKRQGQPLTFTLDREGKTVRTAFPETRT